MEVYEFVVAMDFHLCLLDLLLLRASHSDLCFCYGVWGVEWCAVDFFPFSASYYLPLIVAVVVGVVFILTCGCQSMLMLTI